MANPYQGEVSLKAGDKTYTLALTINAICDVEEETGQDLMGSLRRLSTLRLMLYAAMRQNHPEITRAQAGEIITIAGAKAVTDAVSTAIARAFPKTEKATAANP